MDFLSIIAFLALYYIRPQEWVPGLSSLRPVMIVFIFAIATMLLRDRGFKPKDLLRTPHDTVMLLFFLWLALVTASEMNTNWLVPNALLRNTLVELWANKNLMGFYFIVLQALSSMERLEKFLWWWLGMILLISILAIASEYGFDIMDSYRITHGPRMQGRLVLNNGLYRNPNELGHSVIPLIPLIYLLCIWKRPPAFKQFAALILFFPLYCVYLTKSKGSYLSGAVTAGFAAIFGRPLMVQISMIVLALTVGVTALKMLPRMSDLASPRDEEGIQGRLVAFFFGYDSFRHFRHLGKEHFIREFKRRYEFPKASHSSYNQIAAELGPIGFYLYLAAFYCALKTLLKTQTRNLQEERIRRVLLAAVIAFMTSSWMIDFAYHGTFFFLMAMVAAFHRHMLAPAVPEKEPGKNAPRTRDGTAGFNQQPLPHQPNEEQAAHATTAQEEKPEPSPTQIAAISWNRLSWRDYVGILIMVILAERFWHYIIFTWGTS